MVLSKLMQTSAKIVNISQSPRGTQNITIINTKTNGKRLKLSSLLIKALENPKNVKIAMTEEALIIVPSEKGFKVGESGNIYNTSTIVQITQQFSLDFSEKTSLLFLAEIEKDEETAQKFAYIKMI